MLVSGIIIGIAYFQGRETNATDTSKSQTEQTKKMTPISLPKPDSVTIDTSKSYKAIVKTTVGNFTIELTAKETPITVNNFIYLSKNSFYDNTIFHRVMTGFMIQGGDPTGTGSGGPGYSFNDEPFDGEYVRGTVAMANAGPNTNGSQFFVMHGNMALPKEYVIFGQVVEGMDVVDSIANAQVAPAMGGEMSKPVHPEKILTVEIVEN